MGACLLAAGTKGKRACLPNSQVMLHQPLIGGVLQGPATDLGIEAQHMIRLRDRLYKLMADYTGKTQEQIHRDFDRNKWLFSDEAVEYGVADRVLDRAPEGQPRHPDVTVRVQFTDELTGRQFTAQSVVKVDLPPTAQPATQPAQVSASPR
jgi:ATP-dependent Clp protease protease subunit